MKLLSTLLVAFATVLPLCAQNLKPQNYKGDTEELKIAASKTWEIVSFEPVAVIPGEKYEVSAWLKLENAKQSHVKIEWLNSSRRPFKQDYLCTGRDGTRDWFKITRTFTAPNAAWYMMVKVFAGGTAEQPGVTYFRDGNVRSLQTKPDRMAPLTTASVLKPTGNAVSLDKIAGYTVYYPQQPNPQEKYAAEELAAFLGRIYGSEFKAMPEPGSIDGPFISVGNTRLAGRAGIVSPIREQGYKLEVRDGNLYIAGGTRGILYGVLALLEEDLGCRRYAVDMLPVVPENRTGTLTVVPRESAPDFRIRETLYAASYDPAWASFNRIMPLSYFHNLSYEEGGGWSNTGYFIHTYSKLIPAEKYFKTHPEFFPLIDGKRFSSTPHKGQLCYTAPGLAEEIAGRLEEAIKQNPHARIYSVSSNDNRVANCECPRCQALIKRDGIPGAQLDLANRVADLLAKKYPDILISTLAYVDSQVPPQHIKPSKNVLIVYAPIHQRANMINMLLPINEVKDPLGRERVVEAEIYRWRQMADHVLLWDYADRYEAAAQPFPTFDAQSRGYDFLKQLGVMGIFSEVAHGEISSLGALKSWIFAKKMWDTSRSMDELIREFVTEYYGPAAPKMMEYINFQRAKWNYWYQNRRKGETIHFTDDDLARMDTMLAQTLADCGGQSDYADRVEAEQLVMLSFRLSQMPNKHNLETYRQNIDCAKALLARHPGLYLRPYSNVEVIKNWEANYCNTKDASLLPSSSPNAVQYKNKTTHVNLSQYLKDPEATGGYAVRQIGRNAWGVQWHYPFFIDAMDLSKNYVVRMRARGEFKQQPSKSGELFKLYNYSPGLGVTTGSFTARYPARDDGKYRWYDLGRIRFVTPGVTGYFYNETLLRPEEGVWYDYMELVPEDEYRGPVPLKDLPLMKI